MTNPKRTAPLVGAKPITTDLVALKLDEARIAHRARMKLLRSISDRADSVHSCEQIFHLANALAALGHGANRA